MVDTSMQFFNIGEVAKLTNVTVETIRYYEKQGLVEIPRRNDSGYRQYPDDTIKRIKFIQHAKEVGFTLNDIKELLELRNDQNKSCSDVKNLADLKIQSIDQKIADLQRIKSALTRMVKKCSAETPSSECPLLDELEL